MSAPGWRWVSRTRARRAGVRRRRRMRVMGKFMGIVYEVRGKANHRDHRGKERTQRRATANAGVSPLRAARFGRDDGFVRSLRRVSRRSGFPAGMTSKKDKYGDSDSASQNDDLKGLRQNDYGLLERGGLHEGERRGLHEVDEESVEAREVEVGLDVDGLEGDLGAVGGSPA